MGGSHFITVTPVKSGKSGEAVGYRVTCSCRGLDVTAVDRDAAGDVEQSAVVPVRAAARAPAGTAGRR